MKSLAQKKSVLLVFDKFKDTLASSEICSIVAAKLHEHFADTTQITAIPISDGGDGFIDCMHQILSQQTGPRSLQRKTIPILDPLQRPVQSSYLLDREASTAYIEVANSAGLQMLKREERDPFKATSIVSHLCHKA